jgi:hypothetical protein
MKKMKNLMCNTLAVTTLLILFPQRAVHFIDGAKTGPGW